MTAATPLTFLSAGLRHMRDAEHLEQADPSVRSLDQAYHLAGFAPECLRKATLTPRIFDLAIGHGVTARSEPALEMALAIDPVAQRYDLVGWAARYPAIHQWSEGCRYDQTGTRSVADVRALLAEARELVDAISFALWADGHVPKAFRW